MNIPFQPIKMPDIRPEVKEIAMSWVEGGSVENIASDIQNYADWYAAQKVGDKQRLVSTGYDTGYMKAIEQVLNTITADPLFKYYPSLLTELINQITKLK